MKYNLLYSKHGSVFRNRLRERYTEVREKFKDFTALVVHDDDKEIPRGYDVFPELKEEYEKDEFAITVAKIKNCLTTRGIKDSAFQQKILSSFHQGRLKLPFTLLGGINGLLIQNEILLHVDSDFILQVLDENSVDLVFTNTLKDLANNQEIAKYTAVVNISPKECVLKSSSVEVLENSDKAQQISKIFASQQQNIIMKIITFIKHKLGFYGDFIMYKFPAINAVPTVHNSSSTTLLSEKKLSDKPITDADYLSAMALLSGALKAEEHGPTLKL